MKTFQREKGGEKIAFSSVVINVSWFLDAKMVKSLDRYGVNTWSDLFFHRKITESREMLSLDKSELSSENLRIDVFMPF